MKIITTVLILLITSPFVNGQSREKKIDSICQAISKENPAIGISVGYLDN